MLTKKGFITAFAIASAAIWLIGFSIADAQQNPPDAVTKSPSPTPTPAPTPDDEVIKVDTEVVNVLFTAQDRNRRLLTDLKPGDIRLLEDGKVQELIAFSRQVDLPLSLAILIDTSGSQERTLPEEKAAAISFLESVVRPAKDEVCIVSFTGEATLEQGFTNNMTRLRRSVSQIRFIPPSGYIGAGVLAGGTPPISGDNQAVVGSTAIWDAIWVTSDEILGPAPEKTRRAIILLSDGVNTFGKKKLDDAVQAALRSEAVIYSIGIGDNFYSGVDRGSLNKISERTGGRAYFPKDERELRDAFNQIQEEMRSQYLIAYEPTNQNRDGVFRKIAIELTNQQMQKDKVKVTHRQGYFAKTPQKK
ncbi:MAG TPA: VWA domain-containing protein [Pyrinomonadaceae bacterium]|nr:VWA domain-containing protein [Pyrinomonadaceae bacterium]